MRSVVWTVFLMAMCGLALAVVMLPRAQELAVMQLKARQYSEARSSFEDRWRAGNLSGSTVQSLVELYEVYGDVELAIELLEEFVHDNPRHLEAHHVLKRLYDDAMRPGDALRNLESLHMLAPSQETLRELAQAYAFAGQTTGQIDVLAALAQRREATQQELALLARLLAARGRLDDAADLLLRAQKGKSVAPEMRRLLLSLLIDLRRTDEAVNLATTWIDDDRENLNPPEIVDLFLERGLEPQALTVLEHFGSHGQLSQRQRLARIQLLMSTGATHRALDEVLAWRRASLPIDAETYPELIEVALALEARPLALDLARDSGAAELPSFLLLALVDAALAERRNDLADSWLALLNDEWAEGAPIPTARIALARGDTQTASRALDRFLARSPAILEEAAEAAGMLVILERDEDARTLLSSTPVPANAPSQLIADVAVMLVELGFAQQALPAAERLRSRTTDPTAAAAWARVAAAAGHTGEVVEWLGQQQLEDVSLLQSLFESAEVQKDSTLALMVARRLVQVEPSDQSTLRLASALGLSLRLDAAVTAARALVDSGYREAEPLLLELLRQTHNQTELQDRLLSRLEDADLPRQEEGFLLEELLELGVHRPLLDRLQLRATQEGGDWLFTFAEAAKTSQAGSRLQGFLEAELRRDDLSRQQQQERIALMEELAPEAALAELQRLMENDPAAWTKAYVDALSLGGDRGQAAKDLARVARDPSSPASVRRDVAFRLLGLGADNDATAAFLQLAQQHGPGGAELQQLLFLWGPRPPTEALAWLAQRAQGAPPSELPGWLDHLLDRGAPQAVVDVLDQHRGPMDETLLSRNVQACDQLGHRDCLEESLPRLIARSSAPDELRRCADTAQRNGLTQPARTAWEKLRLLRPADREAALSLASSYEQSKEFQSAGTVLGSAVDRHPADYELRYALARVLVQLNRREDATAHFEAALRLLDSIPERTVEMKLTEANSLARLGRFQDAEAAFERLLETRPGDRLVRADYAAVLLEAGSTQRARVLLEGGTP